MRDTSFEIFGGVRLDVMPGLKAALEVRPVIVPAAVRTFARLLAKHANQGRIEEMIAKEGALFTKEEMAALGLPKWPRMSRETYEMLTPLGREDPWRHLRYVVGRTLGFTYSQHHRRDIMESTTSAIFRHFEFRAGATPDAQPCMEAQSFNGVHPTAKMPIIPFRACNVDGCQCMIRPLTDRMLRQL